MQAMGADVPDTTTELLQTVVAFGLVAVAGGVLSLVVWFGIVGRDGRLLPLQRLRPTHWSGGEVFVVFLLSQLVPAMVYGALQRVFDADDAAPIRQHLLASVLALPLLLALVFLVLHLLSGTRPSHLGLTRARLPHNLVLGYLCWGPLAFLTLTVFFLALLWMKGLGVAIDEHPLTKFLQGHPRSWDWLLIGLEALVAAPLIEEILFRGILQGWLRRCSLRGHGAVAGVALVIASPVLTFLSQTENKPSAVNLGPLIFVLVLLPGYLALVYWGWAATPPPATAILEDKPLSSPEDAFREGPPPSLMDDLAAHVSLNGRPERATTVVGPASTWAAIYGGALLFAVCHAPVWPTPIPLFVLGLGLGWLAQRTQSLVSSLTVHSLFNAVACLVLALEAYNR
jgi:membrane protease YdiL (CAAX protease family)